MGKKKTSQPVPCDHRLYISAQYAELENKAAEVDPSHLLHAVRGAIAAILFCFSRHLFPFCFAGSNFQPTKCTVDAYESLLCILISAGRTQPPRCEFLTLLPKSPFFKDTVLLPQLTSQWLCGDWLFSWISQSCWPSNTAQWCMVMMRGRVNRAPGGPQLTTGLSTVWPSSTEGLEAHRANSTRY